MSKFVTSIKTSYTNVPVVTDKNVFTSTYTSKNVRKMITGDNRNAGKKYASQLMK